jgi:hypothetical protein
MIKEDHFACTTRMFEKKSGTAHFRSLENKKSQAKLLLYTKRKLAHILAAVRLFTCQRTIANHCSNLHYRKICAHKNPERLQRGEADVIACLAVVNPLSRNSRRFRSNGSIRLTGAPVSDVAVQSPQPTGRRGKLTDAYYLPQHRSRQAISVNFYGSANKAAGPR